MAQQCGVLRQSALASATAMTAGGAASGPMTWPATHAHTCGGGEASRHRLLPLAKIWPPGRKAKTSFGAMAAREPQP